MPFSSPALAELLKKEICWRKTIKRVVFSPDAFGSTCRDAGNDPEDPVWE
jgi:hypothetical protein